MSEDKKDRFKRIDAAIDRIREEIDEVADEGRAAGGKASREAKEALDALEKRVDDLRDRKKDE